MAERKTSFSPDECRVLLAGIVDDDESFSMAWGAGYQSLVEKAIGAVELAVSDEDYSGDTYMVVRDSSGLPGFLTFGWGSCSGCDALQACSSFGDLAALMSSLASCVHWCGSDAEFASWMAAHDWKADWHWHRDSLQRFLDEASAKYGFQRPERGE